MFKQGKKSTSLVVTSGTLFSTLVAAPSTSVVTNAVDADISNTLWWVFAIGTFGIYAIYWYIFKDPDKGSGENPPFIKEPGGNTNTGKEDALLGSSNTKNQIRVNSEINGSENKQVASNLKMLIEKTESALKRAYNEKEQIQYTKECLNSDINSYSNKVETLPHQMVLNFNKYAKKFNAKIEDYRKKIKEYKEKEGKKIKKLESKLLKKKETGEAGDKDTFLDLSEYGNSIYSFMEKLEKEFLKPVETIDESKYDNDLDFEKYEKDCKLIEKFRLQCEDLNPFDEFLSDRRRVFSYIKKEKMGRNQKIFSKYYDSLQEAKLEYENEKKELNTVNKKISDLKKTLKSYESELQKYEVKNRNNSSNKESVDTIQND